MLHKFLCALLFFLGFTTTYTNAQTLKAIDLKPQDSHTKIDYAQTDLLIQGQATPTKTIAKKTVRKAVKKKTTTLPVKKVTSFPPPLPPSKKIKIIPVKDDDDEPVAKLHPASLSKAYAHAHKHTHAHTHPNQKKFLYCPPPPHHHHKKLVRKVRVCLKEEERPWYISLKIGEAFSIQNQKHYIQPSNNEILKDRTDHSPFYGIAVGKYLSENIRGELELHRKHPYRIEVITVHQRQIQKLEHITGLLNVFVEPSKQNFKYVAPYLMGGLGFSNNNATTHIDIGILEKPYKTKNSYTFTWNIGSGISIKLNKQVDFDLTLRYIDRGIIPSVIPLKTKTYKFNDRIQDILLHTALKFNFN